MPGRKYSFSSSSYRYGFNGKENDNEVKGEGNQQDYGMRIYDPRLGRFLSVDPLTKTFPYYSPFHYASNSPIKFKDLDGGEPLDYLQNWVPQSLFEMKTGTMVGDGSYMQVWVQSQPQLGMVNVKMVYDKWTKKCWFIHSDDQGNYYYLKNANGESGMMHIAPGKNKNFVRGGEFVKFETQNAIQRRLTGEFVDAMGTSVFIAAAAITGLVAGIEIGAMYSIYKMSKDNSSPARNLLNKALKRQGQKNEKNEFKEKWSDKDGYDYEVRIHEKDVNAPSGSNSSLGRTLRVLRRKQGKDENGQGNGWESADDKGNWYKVKDLKSGKNPGAVNETHIPLP